MNSSCEVMRNLREGSRFPIARALDIDRDKNYGATPRLVAVWGTPSLETNIISPLPDWPDCPKRTTCVSYPAPLATRGNASPLVGMLIASFWGGVDAKRNSPAEFDVHRNAAKPTGAEELTLSSP